MQKDLRLAAFGLLLRTSEKRERKGVSKIGHNHIIWYNMYIHIYIYTHNYIDTFMFYVYIYMYHYILTMMQKQLLKILLQDWYGFVLKQWSARIPSGLSRYFPLKLKLPFYGYSLFLDSHILKSYALFMASFNERCREIVHHWTAPNCPKTEPKQRRRWQKKQTMEVRCAVITRIGWWENDNLQETTICYAKTMVSYWFSCK